MSIFVLSTFLGWAFSGVEYAGFFLLAMSFAYAPLTAYILNLKAKLVGVLAMDLGLIIGSTVRSAYWKSQHGFNSLINWNNIFSLAIFAILVSSIIGIMIFFLERIWPSPKGSCSNQSEKKSDI